MKKIVTIDFDIIMHPSIDIYNDSDLTVDEFLLKHESTLGWMAADLELYRELTNFILSFDYDKIKFIYDHHDIVEEIENITEKIELYNIDYHHDIGYNDKVWTIKLQDYDEGNWVRKLWENNKLKSYTWLRHYNSSDVSEKDKKFLTDKHFLIDESFIKAYMLDDLKDADELYISRSSPWVPSYYIHLYELWEDLTNMK